MLILMTCRRNPCFIRLCFAIQEEEEEMVISRNPCFIRLCFAIWELATTELIF